LEENKVGVIAKNGDNLKEKVQDMGFGSMDREQMEEKLSEYSDRKIVVTMLSSLTDRRVMKLLEDLEEDWG